MSIFKQAFSGNKASEGIQEQTSSSQVANADEEYRQAEQAIQEALLTLGKAYFEKNKENNESDFAENIKIVNDLIGKKDLWHHYKLSLEGKALCDNCGAIVTADSVYCNKCGKSIVTKDFSSLGIIEKEAPTAAVSVCPKCGKSLGADAMFCEKCGTKIEASDSVSQKLGTIQQNNACPKCGNPLVEGAMFCEKCGYKL